MSLYLANKAKAEAVKLDIANGARSTSVASTGCCATRNQEQTI